MKETNRPMALASILMAMFITAIESTIIATAMPSIVAELGGFSLLSWVFSAYLLTQVVTIPIYGKLADLFGRKPVFITGTVIFLFGSLACGFASSMTLLITFRFVQGIGAGAILPIASTMVGDMYSARERGSVQGYISSVFGISSIIGPALGGVFVQYTSWAWIFWINLPLGILSITGISLFLHEKVEKRDQRIDYLGSGLLLMTLGSLMILLIQGGVHWPWVSSQVLMMGALFFAGLIFFIFHELRVQEPVIPMMIWKNRLIAVANFAALAAGAVIMGVAAFLPTYIQGVMGLSPMAAGFTLGAMSFGWPVASSIASRVMLRLGPRKMAVTGGFLMLMGSLFLITLHPRQGPLYAALGAFLIGSGMGFASITFIISIQDAVDWKMRGAATASHMFMRMLGNTLGAAVLGSILNGFLHSYLKVNAGKAQLPAGLDATNILLDPDKRQSLSQSAVEILQEGLAISLHNVFLGVSALAVITLVLVLLLPKKHRGFQKSDVNVCNSDL